MKQPSWSCEEIWVHISSRRAAGGEMELLSVFISWA